MSQGVREIVLVTHYLVHKIDNDGLIPSNFTKEWEPNRVARKAFNEPTNIALR